MSFPFHTSLIWCFFFALGIDIEDVDWRSHITFRLPFLWLSQSNCSFPSVTISALYAKVKALLIENRWNVYGYSWSILTIPNGIMDCMYKLFGAFVIACDSIYIMFKPFVSCHSIGWYLTIMTEKPLARRDCLILFLLFRTENRYFPVM